MDVHIVIFPETRVASIAHRGSPHDEHATALKLVAWKRELGLLDQARDRTYGLHHTDPRAVAPGEHHVEFCLSIDGSEVAPNPYGIVAKTIPRLRCALARDVGSRQDNQAALYLCERWLPSSGETPSGDPTGVGMSALLIDPLQRAPVPARDRLRSLLDLEAGLARLRGR